MTKPTADTIEILRNIKTEIGAGMMLFPKTQAEHAHNNACERANSIIDNYMGGFGLFQMTRNMKKKVAEAPATNPPAFPDAQRDGAAPKKDKRLNAKTINRNLYSTS
jgi:hypothetical protein